MAMDIAILPMARRQVTANCLANRRWEQDISVEPNEMLIVGIVGHGFNVSDFPAHGVSLRHRWCVPLNRPVPAGQKFDRADSESSLRQDGWCESGNARAAEGEGAN